ncbi:MAG: RHS repeat-associated core domain-containing protein [Agriterribacter sp.]
MVKVMAGDRIDIFGKSYYFTNNTGGTGANSAIPVLDILTGLLGGPTGGTAASAHGGVTASQLNGIGDVTSGVTTLLGSQTTDAAGAPAVPKAYINYIFFDEQFRVAASGFSKVGSNSVVKTHTDLTNKTAPKNGYVYIYVSNESPVDVFFDNLQVIHTRGAILEETHYYPYGMKMAGISSKTFDALKNPYQYQGDYSEFNDETGWNDFYLRSYDAQTGRFIQVDPYDQFPSPYTGMGNNPVSNVDPSGGYIFDMAAGQFWGMGIGMVGGALAGYYISKSNGGDGMDGALMGAVGGGALGYGLGSVNWSGVGNALGNAGRWIIGGRPGEFLLAQSLGNGARSGDDWERNSYNWSGIYVDDLSKESNDELLNDLRTTIRTYTTNRACRSEAIEFRPPRLTAAE